MVAVFNKSNDSASQSTTDRVMSNANHDTIQLSAQLSASINTNSSEKGATTMQTKSDNIKVWNNHLTQLGKTQDRESFRQLFDHFSPLIKNFFIAKFPSQQSYQMTASTWIFTLARNTRIDMLRRQNKYAGTSSLEVEDIWEDTTEDGPYTVPRSTPRRPSNRDTQSIHGG